MQESIGRPVSFDLLRHPLPIQRDLMAVDGGVTLLEYQSSLRNENTYLPEVALRFLIYLITSDQTEEEIKNFALQARNELNLEGLERLRRSARELAGAGE